jgi:hypothetical protein
LLPLDILKLGHLDYKNTESNNKNEIVMHPDKLELKRRGKALFHYSLDRLGRVVKSPAGELNYGPNGRVQSIAPDFRD